MLNSEEVTRKKETIPQVYKFQLKFSVPFGTERVTHRTMVSPSLNASMLGLDAF